MSEHLINYLDLVAGRVMLFGLLYMVLSEFFIKNRLLRFIPASAFYTIAAVMNLIVSLLLKESILVVASHFLFIFVFFFMGVYVWRSEKQLEKERQEASDDSDNDNKDETL